MLNTMQVECKLLDQELTSARHEIKDAKEFLKFDITSFIPSVCWTSSDMWDENNTTVEILKMVYGKLKNENEKTFNESTKSLQEIKSNLTRIQDDLIFCKMENENISTFAYNETKMVKEFKKSNFANLTSSADWPSMEKWDENNTVLEILQRLNSELQSGKRNLLNILSQTGEEFKTNFTRMQDYLNSCKSEKDAIFLLVSTEYQ